MNLLKVAINTAWDFADPETDQTFLPVKVIDGYDSLIWTERFQPAGDFELKTSKNIEQMMIDLPLMSFVSLQDSLEVMYVETHSIDQDPDGPVVLTITGRTIESFYENRTTAPVGTGSDDSIMILSPPPDTMGVLAAMINNKINTKEGDIIGLLDDFSASYTPVARARQVPRGNTYEEMLKLLAEDNIGIRNARCRPFRGIQLWPEDGSSYPLYGLGDYGTIVYNGTDRRSTVIFDARAGHFEKMKYLWSVKGYKTSVYVAAKNGGLEVQATGTTNFTNWNRRVYNLDAAEIQTAAGATLNAQLTARGRADLATHNKTVLFEGTVSSENPYIYGYHPRPGTIVTVNGVDYNFDHLGGDYYLGDLVKVIGDYGVRQDMYVTEYVRIEDSTGERGYPSLSLPSEI